MRETSNHGNSLAAPSQKARIKLDRSMLLHDKTMVIVQIFSN
jgi:hypothetical protein